MLNVIGNYKSYHPIYAEISDIWEYLEGGLEVKEPVSHPHHLTKSTGAIRVNLIPVQLNKDVKINRSKYVSVVLSNIQSLCNMDTLLLDHLVEEKLICA